MAVSAARPHNAVAFVGGTKPNEDADQVARRSSSCRWERPFCWSGLSCLIVVMFPSVADYDDPYLQLDFPAASSLPPPCVAPRSTLGRANFRTGGQLGISVIEAAFGYTPDRILYEAWKLVHSENDSQTTCTEPRLRGGL